MATKSTSDDTSVVSMAEMLVFRADDGRQFVSPPDYKILDMARLLIQLHGKLSLAEGVGHLDDPNDVEDETQLEAFAGDLSHLQHLSAVLASDRQGIESAEQAYQASWKARGGVGAFMMLARKWDRLEPRVKACGYNVFNAIRQDHRREGAIDDIRDLRRYLTLVECEMVNTGAVEVESTTKDSPVDGSQK